MCRRTLAPRIEVEQSWPLSVVGHQPSAISYRITARLKSWHSQNLGESEFFRGLLRGWLR